MTRRWVKNLLFIRNYRNFSSKKVESNFLHHLRSRNEPNPHQMDTFFQSLSDNEGGIKFWVHSLFQVAVFYKSPIRKLHGFKHTPTTHDNDVVVIVRPNDEGIHVLSFHTVIDKHRMSMAEADHGRQANLQSSELTLLVLACMILK